MYRGSDVQTVADYLLAPAYVDAGAYVIGVRGEGRPAFDPYYVGQSPDCVYKRVWQFVGNVTFGDHRVPDAGHLLSGKRFRERGFTWAYLKGAPDLERHALDPAARAALQPHIDAFVRMLHVFVVPVATTSDVPDAEQAEQLERHLAAAFPNQIGRVARATRPMDVRLGEGALHLQPEIDRQRAKFFKETT